MRTAKLAGLSVRTLARTIGGGVAGKDRRPAQR